MGALVLSDNTRVFYGRSPGHVEDRYLAHVFGAFRAVLEEHLPVTVICDWNLTTADLKPYKVLVLPNTACLDNEQLAAIREYVHNGGGLVASLDTSLCDEFGDPRKDFGLADVFGAHYRGVIETSAAAKEEIDINFAKGIDDAFWEKRKNIFDLRIKDNCIDGEPRLLKLIGHQPVLFKGTAVAVTVAKEDQAMATMLPRGAATGSPASTTIVAREFGKGRVVYLPAGIDAAYYTYALPYYRVVLSSAIRWAAGGDPPVQIAAPMCVETTVFRQQKNGQRLLIHLFNGVNTTAFHGLPNDDVPLREETIPIHDITVTPRLQNPQSHAAARSQGAQARTGPRWRNKARRSSPRCP